MPKLTGTAINARVLTVSDERRGQALLVLSALAFSVMSVQVKLAGRELPVAMLVLARGIVTLVLSVAWVSARRIHPWGHDRWGLVQRALFGTGALACYFYAVTALPPYWGSTSRAWLTGIAKPTPVFSPVLLAIAVFMPIKWPRVSSKGPPLLPRLSAASI